MSNVLEALQASRAVLGRAASDPGGDTGISSRRSGVGDLRYIDLMPPIVPEVKPVAEGVAFLQPQGLDRRWEGLSAGDVRTSRKAAPPSPAGGFGWTTRRIAGVAQRPRAVPPRLPQAYHLPLSAPAHSFSVSVCDRWARNAR